MNNEQDWPCETPREDLVQRALAHYDEISDQACHWNSVIPAAIKAWGELNKGESVSQLRERIATLESQLADLRDLAYNRAPKIAAEEANAQKADLEAKWANTRSLLQKSDDRVVRLHERIAEFEAQLAEANARAEANYHRMPRRGELGAAIQRAEAAEAHEGGLRAALQEYANEENWHESDSDPVGSPKIVWLYWKDGRDWAGCEIAQEALKAAAEQPAESEVKK